MSRNKTLMVLGVAAGLASTVILPHPGRKARRAGRRPDPSPWWCRWPTARTPHGVAADADAEPVGEEPVGSEPVMSLRVTSSGLDELEQDPRVEAVLTRGTTVEPALAQSVVKVGAPGRHDAGFDGDGKVITVIDTGVASTFGGTLVGQACFAATQVGAALVGHCGTGSNQRAGIRSSLLHRRGVQQHQPLDAQAAPSVPEVPPRAASTGRRWRPIAGAPRCPGRAMAPDAGISTPSGSSTRPGRPRILPRHLPRAGARRGHVRRGRLRHRRGQPLGGDCADVRGGLPDEPGSGRAVVRPRLRGAPRPWHRSRGRIGQQRRHHARIAFPACVPAAISVGSTDLDDDLASFGNRGAGLDLLAPGADEASLGVAVDPMGDAGQHRGGAGPAPRSRRPRAGAFTLMAQEYPNASVAQSTWFLQAAGVPVAEGGRTYRRLLLRPARGAARPGPLPGSRHRWALPHGPRRRRRRRSRRCRRARPGAGRRSDLLRRVRWCLRDRPVHGQRQLHPGGRQPGRGRPRVPTTSSGTRPARAATTSGPATRTETWRPPRSRCRGPVAHRRRLRRGRVGRRPLVRSRRRADRLWYGGLNGPTAVAVDTAGTFSVGVGDFDGGRPRRPAARRPRYGYRRALARGGAGGRSCAPRP